MIFYVFIKNFPFDISKTTRYSADAIFGITITDHFMTFTSKV